MKEMKYKMKTQLLMGFVKAIYPLADEARIEIGKDGWRAIALDGGHVSLVDFRMPKERFTEYTDGEVEIAIDFDRILDFLNRVKGEDATIIIKENVMIDITIDGITRKFPLLDIEGYAKVKVPSMEYTAKIMLDSANAEKLYRALEIADTIEDFIILETENGKCTVKTGEGVNEMSAEIEGVITGEAKSMYPLEHIKPIMKTILYIQKNLDDGEITMEYKTDYPIKISTQNCCYIIAPRIEV